MPRRASVPVDPSTIPDKPFFKIGEAARLCAVKPYVLRYWETEFSALRPSKSKSQHRLYRRKDVDTLLEIKRLLHDERFTIEGARKHLKALAKKAPAGKTTVRKPPPRATEAVATDRIYRSILVRLKKDIASLYNMLRA